MIKCEYCYALAAWGAETANGPRPMCQNHYDELSRARYAESLARIPVSALPLVREARGRWERD